MSLDERESFNNRLVLEAETILNEIGLLNLLEKYGTVEITGSHSLNTMTWRDLDLYLINDEMDKALFFKLGQELATLLTPCRMSFRDEFIGQTEGLPTGYYWGIYADIYDQEWKIDIWAIDPEQAEELLCYLEEIREGLTVEKRKTVLEIKTHFCHRPEYRVTITSQDIYNAVIKDNVNSVESFKKWLSIKLA